MRAPLLFLDGYEIDLWLLPCPCGCGCSEIRCGPVSPEDALDAKADEIAWGKGTIALPAPARAQ